MANAPGRVVGLAGGFGFRDLRQAMDDNILMRTLAPSTRRAESRAVVPVCFRHVSDYTPTGQKPETIQINPWTVKVSGTAPYWVKLKRARMAQVPRVTRAAAADAAGLDLENYAAAERGRSEKSAVVAIAKLGPKWVIPIEWFWDGLDTDVPGKLSTLTVAEHLSVYDPLGELVDISLHIPTNSGKVIYMSHPSGTTKVFTGLAIRSEFAIRVGDSEMAPRFLPGNIVVARPQDIYDDRCYVAAVREDELVEALDGTKHPRLYLRWYTYENGRFMLKARGDGKDFQANSLKILGVVVAVKVGGDEYYNMEIASKALPWDKG